MSLAPVLTAHVIASRDSHRENLRCGRTCDVIRRRNFGRRASKEGGAYNRLQRAQLCTTDGFLCRSSAAELPPVKLEGHVGGPCVGKRGGEL